MCGGFLGSARQGAGGLRGLGGLMLEGGTERGEGARGEGGGMSVGMGPELDTEGRGID